MAERRVHPLVWLLPCFGLAWLTLHALTTRTPPVDHLEQLIWVRSLESGYYKHPPLPTWLLAPGVALVGLQPLLPYVMGALVTLASLAVMGHLLHTMRGRAAGQIAVLAALCIGYYSLRLHYYNHDVVLMLCVALLVWLLWRVTLRPGWAAWAGIGLLLGLGLLAKYQLVVAGLCVVLWWLHLRGWADPVHRVGLPLALGLALLVFAPHLHWLVQHDGLPLTYARESSLGAGLSLGGRLLNTLAWLGDWAFNRGLPALGLLLVLWLWARRDAPAVAAATASDAHSRSYLTLWGVVPLLAMAALGLAGGVNLQKHWASIFALWTVPALIEWLPAGWARLTSLRSLRRAGWLFLLIQLVMGLNVWLTSPRGLGACLERSWVDFPSQHLADDLGPAARAEWGGPIDVLAGPFQLAGALALRLPERPRVLISGQLRYSPWIAADELPRLRVVEVFPAQTPPAGAHALGEGLAWRVGVSAAAQLATMDWRRLWPGAGTSPDVCTNKVKHE